MKPQKPLHRPGAYDDYATIPAIARELAERLGNYEFKLGHALRDLPSPVRFEILDEVRTGILDAIDHQIELGSSPRKALTKVLGEYRSPKDLAREYRQNGRGQQVGIEGVVDLAVIGACALAVTHPAIVTAPGDSLAGVGIWALGVIVAVSAVVTRVPLHWATHAAARLVERGTIGFQILGIGVLAQAVHASLVYNLASHDLKLTLQNVGARSAMVVCGMLAAEHHRRRTGRVHARNYVTESDRYLKEFFAHRFDQEAVEQRRRAVEYFTQEDL